MMKVINKPFDASLQSTVDVLNRDGVVCFDDVISPEWLENARSQIRNLLDQHGEKYFSVVRPSENPGSPAYQLKHDPEIQRLVRDVAALGCPQGVGEEDVYDVLRVVAGPRGESGSLLFHYDASVITALVPIFVPEGHGDGESGELVTFTNLRPFRQSNLLNLAEKAVVQNSVYRSRMKDKFDANRHKHMQVLSPGNLYLFWGYRTYHGNLACQPNSLRATMLLHYGNPHGNNLLLNAVRRGRSMFENIRRAQ